MIGLLGKKIGMTHIFVDGGKLVPVTVIEAGPCCVIQVKTPEKDGYGALKVGFGEVLKEEKVNRPERGVFKKAGTANYKVLREFQMSGFKQGEFIRIDSFSKGERVSVSGLSKGKGFQGTMKRHNFKGGPDTHGSMFNRAPGSIGASSFPSRVWKGKGMAGHMGDARITVRNLEVVDIKPERNLLFVRGAVPGSVNALLEIWKDS